MDKKKIFLSYRFTGEDPIVLEETLGNICGGFEKLGHECFCSFWKQSFFKENNFSLKDIMDYAVKEIDNSDVVVVFVKSEEKSEGMLIEVGYALAKNKKIILLVKEGIKTTFLHNLADQIFEFKNFDDLYLNISNLIL